MCNNRRTICVLCILLGFAESLKLQTHENSNYSSVVPSYQYYADGMCWGSSGFKVEYSPSSLQSSNPGFGTWYTHGYVTGICSIKDVDKCAEICASVDGCQFFSISLVQACFACFVHKTCDTQATGYDYTVYTWGGAPAPAPAPGGGGKAGGDPHLLNIKGEKFNIVRQGYAPLVNIASDGAAQLEVMALIEGVRTCSKKMFITQVNSSGSWLEKHVAVVLETDNSELVFSVMVDGQRVWSPAQLGYHPPTTENIVFNHGDRFSISELTAKATTAKLSSGIEVKTAHDVTMKIMRPLHRSSTTPHLNFDIQGLKNLPKTFKVGGLLGEDDHAFWSNRQEEQCAKNFAHDRNSAEDGSVASAQ